MGVSNQIIVSHHVDSSGKLQVSSNKQKEHGFFWVKKQKHVYLCCKIK